MTASEVVQSLIIDTPTDDVERLNKLFQLQTLVGGLEDDLHAYQQKAMGLEQQVAVLSADKERLADALQEAERVNPNQSDVQR